jgi:acyl-ACP thioesterase
MGKVKCSESIAFRAMSSMSDDNTLMSIPAMLDAVQDISGIHAYNIGISGPDLEEKGIFWIVSKLKLRILRRPAENEELTLSTWIQKPDRASTERDCSFTSGDEVLAYSRCIWAALRRDNGRIAQMSTFYPDSDFDIPRPDEEPFARISKDFSDAEEIGRYTIRSVDIDRGGHMNNVNYVRTMLGCFSCGELRDMDISCLDMQFLHQCYEGETISIRKRDASEGFEIGILSGGGVLAFAAAVK